jgi:hypothetical protein
MSFPSRLQIAVTATTLIVCSLGVRARLKMSEASITGNGKRTNMNCRPPTSGGSHLLGGMFLGVSARNRNQNSLKLPMFSA